MNMFDGVKQYSDVTYKDRNPTTFNANPAASNEQKHNMLKSFFTWSFL